MCKFDFYLILNPKGHISNIQSFFGILMVSLWNLGFFHSSGKIIEEKKQAKYMNVQNHN